MFSCRHSRSFSAFLRRNLAIAVTLLIVTTPAGASWFSKARHVDAQGNPVALDHKSTSDLTVFDLSISLYNQPTGDDDPANDTGSEQQTQYETIIGHWADAVCEQSNGAHQLGRIRIFRNGAFSTRADVVWNQREWPRAHASGFGTDNLHITFGDIFRDGAGTGNDLNLLNDPVGAGYTLGHEFGHYIYGLYDEYRGRSASGPITHPRSGDTPTSPSIMSSQWMARGGNFEWLNHSTSDNYQANTAQGRAHGASGWEVLVRDPKNDSRQGSRSSLPDRTQYTALDGNQPTAVDGWVRTELDQSGNGCRDRLEIIWMADEDVEMQVVLDRSGSMGGAPLDNAKVAAQNLAEVVREGQTALGLVTFNSTASQTFPITAIPDPGGVVKQQIKDAIAALSAGGLTAMFDAADLALQNLEAYQSANSTSANRVAFLLSDGEDNSSSETETTVSDAYSAADVPLITFGYGSASPNGVLRRLADSTGGQFYASPTTLAEIQNAFLTALTSVSSSVTVQSFAQQASAGANNAELTRFAVDSTLESFSIFLNHDGPVDALSLSLNGPAGTVPGAPFTCQSLGGVTNCVAQVDAATVAGLGNGAWSVRGTNTAGFDLDLDGLVIANPTSGRTFDVMLSSPQGTTVHYPEPIVLTAAVSQGMLIAGASVVATITDPSGQIRVLTMHDDGLDGDGRANDGIYTLLMGYDQDGVYGFEVRVDNANGEARTAIDGYQPTHFSVGENGEEPPQPAPQPITENFERRGQTQITIEGLSGDDHPDLAPGTPLVADNSDLSGRIDFRGDPDYFRLEGLPTSGSIFVRVSDLALGMSPQLVVFDDDGTTTLASGNLSNHATATGYVALEIPASQIPASGTLFARVTQVGGQLIGGTYRISAGPALPTDGTVSAPPEGTCTADGTTLCLRDRRFAVKVDWQDFSGNTGSGKAITLTEETGYFWFFNSDNVEIALKVLDGRPMNDRFWVFYGALSNVMYTITVTDTITGSTSTYDNPSGRFASVADTDALPGSQRLEPVHRFQTIIPEEEAPIVSRTDTLQQTCTAGPNQLCLNNDRFQVRVDWRAGQQSGTGQAVPLTDESGYFWFFDANNVELVIKALDGRGYNGHFWIFYGSLSDTEFTIEVTDTMTGEVRTYRNPQGMLASFGDTRAFPGS